MKKAKKILSLFLAALMVLTCVPISISAEEGTTYNVGDIIKYGNYPQSRVTDETLLSELDEIEKDWKSLNYYSGTGNKYDGSMYPSDYAKYADFEYGTEKYRAILFTAYRPWYTWQQTTTDGNPPYNSGYYINTVYYFKYEPIKWRVLDPNTGLVMCDNIIDAQPYNNTFVRVINPEDNKYVIYKDTTSKTYTNNYEASSIRDWLNSDFYNTSFVSSQKSNIAISTLNNDAYQSNYSEYNSDPTNDKIFLLSRNEASVGINGFDTENDLIASGTDYAICQRLNVSTENNTHTGFSWMLRTAGNGSTHVCHYGPAGGFYSATYTYDNGVGIRPACKLSIIRTDTQKAEQTYGVDDIIEYGNYPQSLVEDEELIAQLNATESEWISYNYYTGSAANTDDEALYDGKMHPSDYMKYRDVTLDGEKYRAVTFSKYRMLYTGLAAQDSGEYDLNTCQYDNGYNINTIYWFKFEPIEWYIIDPDEGLILAKNALDSQPFNNCMLKNGSKYYGDSEMKNYANNYYYSSIRKWLSEDFYNTAFTGIQKNNIKPTEIIIKNYYTNEDHTCNDKIFLLSSPEVKDVTAKVITGTDYAKCNGLDQQSGKTKAHWWDRTILALVGDGSSRAAFVNESASYNTFSFAYNTGKGIRPALKLSSLQPDTEQIKGEETNPHISWNYDGNCHLYISGEGAINYADEYGWEKYADEIMYIEVSDGITSLPENIFSALPYLTEVYFGYDVAEISSNAFSDCPLLTAVTFNGNAQINNGAFTNASKYLTFILNGETDIPKDFAEQNNIRIVTASYDTDKKALNFTGDITVFDCTKYDSLHNILCQHSDAEYLYFTKLIFADANPNISIKDDALEAETTPNGLILNNVYVRLILVNENGEQTVSFEKMLELLESGDYTAFKYNAKSDEKEEEGTLFSKIVEAVQRALQFISKLINLIRRLFKR